MDQAIYVSSSSSGSSNDGQSLLYGFDDYGIPDDEWPEYYDRDLGENATGRPPKKQKVRGLDGTANDEALDTLASLGPSSSQLPLDVINLVPEADQPDLLFSQTLEMFPGISHTYVKDLIARHKGSLQLDAELKGSGYEMALARDAIYEEILGQKAYPKQDSENAKRKRAESSDSDDNWMSRTTSQTNTIPYSQIAATVLANEFPLIPMQHLRNVLANNKRLYHAYLALHSDESFAEKKNPYTRLKSSRTAAALKTNAYRDIVTRELNAAKKQIEKSQATARKKKEEEEAERLNEEEHVRTGDLIECQCCYGDVPANRCLPCEGDELHFFCFTCIRRSADTQIGIMKYTLHCFDVSGCKASFGRPQLREILGSAVMDKLDSLQQEDEIRLAGLEGLEDCPFCSFKAVLPPVEEDREFRCENASCKVVSCRLCRERSHVPLTCEEDRKDKGLSERHQVEEAMSEALIRKCPKCKVQIVKEDGCNKMHCIKCGTSMCYVCQKDITKELYNHFGRGCRQDDGNTQEREHREIQKAERAAIDKILAENPDITEEQIRVGHTKSKKTQPRGIPMAQIPEMGYFAAAAQPIQRPVWEYLYNQNAMAADNGLFMDLLGRPAPAVNAAPGVYAQGVPLNNPVPQPAMPPANLPAQQDFMGIPGLAINALHQPQHPMARYPQNARQGGAHWGSHGPNYNPTSGYW
ncbi:E3 ubiquitin-protein ligase RNF216 [Aspergillus undulatus]|uniref:E3 ubiquitin-protein ligase RNF216 n=1 Tax=Aspergillus undulatus TaxID=1810928 RepID=UPI003CCD3EFC